MIKMIHIPIGIVYLSLVYIAFSISKAYLWGWQGETSHSTGFLTPFFS